MSQEIDRSSDWPRTLHGSAPMEESTPGRDPWEPKFVRIGARVGRSGQVFETEARAGFGGVVVKLFTWAAGLPAQVVQDFTRDVTMVADLHHPHVAQVLDAGALGDGTPFVVMERLAGMTLDETASGRSVRPAEVLPILRGIGSALSAAHAAGIAHGQLRADNVFVANAMRHGPASPKVLDFGVERLVAGAREPGRGALGHRAAERADQLALATLAWRLLGSTSAPVQLVLLRAMSPDPSQRFGSVATLVEALEEASGRAEAAGIATKAATMRMLAGPSAVASPKRLQRVVVVAPSSLPAAPPLAAAPGPVLPSAPSSLTQQFFAEGEQLDKAHGARHMDDAGTVAEQDIEDDDLGAAAAAHVPRSRAQMIATAFLCLGSVAMIGWTVVALVAKPEGRMDAAAAAPPTLLDRRAAVAPAGTLLPVRTTKQGQGAQATHARRSAPVQPQRFAAPAKPSVAAADAPPPSHLDVAPIQAPRPWVDSPHAATDATPLPVTSVPRGPTPSAGPVEGNGDQTEPEEQSGDQPRSEEPPARPTDATLVAPVGPGDLPRPPSPPDAPVPSEPAQRAAP
jgi:hypothetical protein